MTEMNIITDRRVGIVFKKWMILYSLIPQKRTKLSLKGLLNCHEWPFAPSP